MISIIVAMGRNRVIGCDGGIPWKCRTDLQRFKAITMGHHCIVGRKTYEGLPPLPGRKLIVVTRQPGYDAPLVASSVEQAIEHRIGKGEVFIIGGAEIYQRALPLVGRMYVSTMLGDFVGDTFFPKFDLHEWNVAHYEHADDHAFEILERVTPK